MKIWLCAALLLSWSGTAQAAVKTETVEYKQGETVLKGYLAYDDATTAKRPGVLVVHEWWGLDDYAKRRAEELAKAGYVAFALDMYGEGKNTRHPEQAGEWSSAVARNPDASAARFQAALDQLKKQPRVDSAKVAAIGYCFGGGVVLKRAVAGADLRGVVSFHGALPADPVAAGTAVKAKILVCNGADDGFVTPEQIATFQKNLTQAKADWQFVNYSGAKHSFTNPNAASFGIDALAYNEAADRRSWQAMLSFFGEIFAN
jgi:dienelactone hydrolase